MKMSEGISIKTGVPQRTIWRLLLFKLFINIMSFDCDGLKGINFADNPTLYGSGKNIDSLVSNMNDWMLKIYF